MKRTKDITAVILAGGKNSRLQVEKSLLTIDGCHLIDRQVMLLKEIFEKIIIVSSKIEIKHKFPDLKIVEDKFKDCGPLGGIHAAMQEADTNSIFVFACDMPFLNKKTIHKQIAVFQNSNIQILVPRNSNGIEPLHAIYSVSNIKQLENCLNTKRFSVRSFYEKSKTSYIDFNDSHRKDFYNINTAKDLLLIS